VRNHATGGAGSRGGASGCGISHQSFLKNIISLRAAASGVALEFAPCSAAASIKQACNLAQELQGGAKACVWGVRSVHVQRLSAAAGRAWPRRRHDLAGVCGVSLRGSHLEPLLQSRARSFDIVHKSLSATAGVARRATAVNADGESDGRSSYDTRLSTPAARAATSGARWTCWTDTTSRRVRW
jgi:hypothetical protein